MDINIGVILRSGNLRGPLAVLCASVMLALNTFTLDHRHPLVAAAAPTSTRPVHPSPLRNIPASLPPSTARQEARGSFTK